MSYVNKSIVQLFAMPTLLTVLLIGLIALNPEVPQKADLPGPETPQSIPIVSKPYLDAEEDLRLGAKYEGDTVTIIMSPQSYYQGDLVLVNQVQRLPEDYGAQDLIVAREGVEVPNPQGFSVSKPQLMLNQHVVEQLLNMIQGAYEDGVTGYTLVSGHRELSYQVGLFQRKVDQYKKLGLDDQAAEERAKQIVAVPGESEHHTGLALDLPSRRHPTLEITYVDTLNGAWLRDHAWKYGFIIRYPADKVEITGISYEPWHLRYVGRPHSEIMARENWCLEEYIDVLRQSEGMRVRLSDGSIWQISYQLAEDGLLKAPVSTNFTISGDGREGYIITLPLVQQDQI